MSQEEKIQEQALPHHPSFTEAITKPSTESSDESKIFVIGVCGGDCSGKRLIHTVIKQYFDSKKIVIASVPQQSFLLKNSHQNMYEPNAYDWKKIIESVSALKQGKSIKIRPFDKIRQEVQEQEIIIEPSSIIVVHGLHILSNQELKKLLSISCYVDSDDDIRLSRRVYQDTKNRGKTITECIHNYLQNIKPAYQRYTEPLKKVADLLVPKFGGDYIANEANIQNAGFENSSNKAVGFLLQAIAQLTGIKGKVGQEVSTLISRSTSIRGDNNNNVE